MSRLVELKARKQEIYEPWEAGEDDPPMQDWLQLPIGREDCPACDFRYWGKKNPIGYFPVRYCKGCGVEFRGEVDTQTIKRIIGALTNEPIRLARS